MKIHKTRLGALGALVASLALVTSACGGSSAGGGSAGTGGSGGNISVTLLPKNLGNPYFDTSEAGVKKAIGVIGRGLSPRGDARWRNGDCVERHGTRPRRGFPLAASRARAGT